MKIILKIWLFGAFGSIALAQSSYSSQQLSQDTLYDSDESSYHPSSSRRQATSSYVPVHHEEGPETDPRHYQSLEQKHRPYEAESYPRHQSEYHNSPQQVQYHQPEDPSYHRPQEIVYHQPRQSYQAVAPQPEEHYQGTTHYSQPEVKEDTKYEDEEPKYVQAPRSHPAPVPTDPKLPLYFTMYEKRTIQDPLTKYGKGPWRYLTYGHGITYGSKEPGKVFEKGYGYIRALGRDHCKLPEHLCPPRDEKPFDYEGRKEPYFDYRPH